MKTLIRMAAVAAVAVPMALSMGNPAHAESNPSCGSVTQIGDTGYIKSGGQTFASVKQFKGCGKNWGYVYVWESWRQSHRRWDMCVLVRVGRSSPYDYQGERCSLNTGSAELWSGGTGTLDECTMVIGHGPDMREEPRPGIGATDMRC
jgi:hypothetical protein